MRFIIADLARKVVGFVVRHVNEENRGYLRHAGIVVEEFVTSEPLSEKEVAELFEYCLLTQSSAQEFEVLFVPQRPAS